ncbi:MAG: MerC domain-containing protein [Planctomycetota bacterium]
MSIELTVVDHESVGTSQPSAAGRLSGWGDWLGMFASIGCAIHCAAMPFVIAYLPALGLSFLADEAFHQWAAVGCFFIAVAAFIPGLRKHRQLTPVIVGSIGLAIISFAAFGLAGECCAACAAKAAGDGAAVAGETCTDESCPFCDRENSRGDDSSSEASMLVSTFEAPATPAQPEDSSAPMAQVELPAVESPQSEWIALIAPWLTPLGGVVLVIAHLLNRRCGYVCGCCKDEASVPGAA